MSFQLIPSELVATIANYCSIEEVSKLYLTRKSIKHTLEENVYWKRRFTMDFIETWPEKLILTSNWKRIYKQRFLTLQNWKTGKFRSTKLYYLENGVKKDVIFTSATINRHIHLYVDLKSKLVVSVSMSGNGVVWSLETSKTLLNVSHNDHKISAAYLNEKMCITASDDGILKIWNLNKTEIIEYGIPRTQVSHVQMHNANIYCGNEDGQLIRIELLTKTIKVVQIHNEAITCFSINEEYIVTGGLDKAINVMTHKCDILKRFDFNDHIFCVSLTTTNVYIGHSNGLSKIDILTLDKQILASIPDEAVISVKASIDKVIYTYVDHLRYFFQQCHHSITYQCSIIYVFNAKIANPFFKF